MSLLIRNGTIVTADKTFVGDVLCEGETITGIGVGIQAPAGAEVIDATGKYLSARIGVLEGTWFRYAAAFLFVFMGHFFLVFGEER